MTYGHIYFNELQKTAAGAVLLKSDPAMARQHCKRLIVFLRNALQTSVGNGADAAMMEELLRTAFAHTFPEQREYFIGEAERRCTIAELTTCVVHMQVVIDKVGAGSTSPEPVSLVIKIAAGLSVACGEALRRYQQSQRLLPPPRTKPRLTLIRGGRAA
ncbi:hypothetical protein EXS62_01855 [Candidatus Kaiserbacteria bacterium]|nr:hypothetical protein [Candidatus Kaiserbacteria bacterium]